MNELDSLKDENDRLKRELWFLKNDAYDEISNRLDTLENMPQNEPVLIYDKDSMLTAVNRGLTSGIKLNHGFNEDLSRFKNFKVYFHVGDGCSCLIFPRPESQDENSFNPTHIACTSKNAIVTLQLNIFKNLNGILFKSVGVYQNVVIGTSVSFRFSDRDENTAIIVKIEGYER